MSGSNTLCREQLQDTSTGEYRTETETVGSMSTYQEAVTDHKDAPEQVSWEEFVQKKKFEIGPDAAQTISTFFEPLQQGIVLLFRLNFTVNKCLYILRVSLHSHNIMLVQVKKTTKITLLTNSPSSWRC